MLGHAAVDWDLSLGRSGYLSIWSICSLICGLIALIEEIYPYLDYSSKVTHINETEGNNFRLIDDVYNCCNLDSGKAKLLDENHT